MSIINKENLKKMENELYDLRKFKQETEEMCASYTVIQNMNQELENVRELMNAEITKYKESSISYEGHINHVYDNLTSKILESIESDYFNIGIYHFNIVEKISEFCDSNIMINLLKKKMLNHIKRYNINIDQVYYYTHKSNEDYLIIFDNDDIDYINMSETVVDLVCPYNDELYIECNCAVCNHLKSHDDMNNL